MYNGTATLGESIASIIAQTCDDWEMIVFDDGSTDDSLAIAEQFAESDSRIRVMPSPHVGICAALRAACATAQGTFIARMDADDLCHPRRLEKQLDLMECQPNLALCGVQVAMMGNTIGEGRRRYEEWINSQNAHDEITKAIFIECPIAHPTFFMRRDWYEKVGGYTEGPWPEDYDLLMRLHVAGARFANVPEVLFQWRDHENRLSMSDERYGLPQFRALKRRYLFQTILADDRPFYQWGAGDVGKAWLREWGVTKPIAVVDIHPRKIGRVIHDVPVIAPEELPAPGEAPVLAAVGAPGAREDIRGWLMKAGYIEGRDLYFLA
jgi:glycosyltransferase involved in cell wall biosynthesis